MSEDAGIEPGTVATLAMQSEALRGLCHEIKYFLKVLKIKSVPSVNALRVFKFFSCLVMEKIKDEVLACFYENNY